MPTIEMTNLLNLLRPFQDSAILSDINHIQAVWEELEHDETEGKRLELDITNEIIVLLKNKIKTIKAREDHALRKHRVEKVRTQIGEWWLKCRYSEEQKSAFRAFRSEVFTDELLRIHQDELTFLMKYHQDNLTLFDMVDQYLALNERNLFLLAQDKNPNRLFENRGGQLLKDERDRKTARKELPKMENKIKNLIEVFETTYNRQFLIEGKTFSETLQIHTDKCNENIDAANEQNVAEVKARVSSNLKRKPLDNGWNGSRKAKSARKAHASPNPQQGRKFKTLNMI